jgi:hypothetical protein
MANFKYFTTCQNETVQLQNVYHSGKVSAKPVDFSGTCPICGGVHTAQRKVERKSNPSNHKCDARCLNAKGFKCECSCGGKNHGAEA